jgi:hypothetical protein
MVEITELMIRNPIRTFCLVMIAVSSFWAYYLRNNKVVDSETLCGKVIEKQSLVSKNKSSNELERFVTFETSYGITSYMVTTSTYFSTDVGKILCLKNISYYDINQRFGKIKEEPWLLEYPFFWILLITIFSLIFLASYISFD